MHGQTHSWTVNHTDRRISARTDEIACVALYYPITLEWHEKKNCIWVMCFVVYWSFELCAPWFTDHLSYVLRGLLIIWVMCSVIYWSSELCASWFTDHLSCVLRDLLIIWVMCSVVYWSFELCAPWFTDHLSYVLRGLLIIWAMCSLVYWSFELCAPWLTDHLSYVLRGLLIICKNTLRVEQDHTPCIMDPIFSTHPLKIAKFTEMRKSNVLALIWMIWDTLMLKLIANK